MINQGNTHCAGFGLGGGGGRERHETNAATNEPPEELGRGCTNWATEMQEDRLTLAGRGTTVVLQMGAVLALVVLRALAEVVRGEVEALSAALAGVRLAVIYIKLGKNSGIQSR